MMTRKQCKAARAVLDWTQPDLAAKANVSVMVIVHFEKATRIPHETSLLAMQIAFKKAGINFIEDGYGITWKRPEMTDEMAKFFNKGDKE